ncbi:MAG: hypothetical protein WA208_13965 [Thermoanaerobaculia bacterium]
MRCAAAKRLIVLDAGDLSPAEAGKLSSHLATCETCRQFASLPADVPPDFRAEVPLTPADFTRIRASVRASVRERGTSFLPFGLWAPAATAAVVMAFGWFTMRSPSLPETPPELPPPAPRHDVRSPSSPSPSYAGPKPSPEAKPAPYEMREPRVARSRGGKPLVQRSAELAAVPSPIEAATAQARPLLIEIHTADPDVRILWIAQQAPAEPNPTTGMED